MEALDRILSDIKRLSNEAGRDAPPLLLAVSKFQSVEKMIELMMGGQKAFGENYVQELLAKKLELKERGHSDVEFHFIGKLQTNKVKQLLPHVKAIHSVDSLRLLDEIEKRAKDQPKKPEVYIQVNIDEEASKGGFSVSALEEVCERVRRCGNLVPAGLMAIPDPDRNATEAFQKMLALSQRYGDVLGRGLSMGMSGDYPEAIRYGSTVIRVGTALFGKRT